LCCLYFFDWWLLITIKEVQTTQRSNQKSSIKEEQTTQRGNQKSSIKEIEDFCLPLCAVCPSLIDDFWLPLWYLQTFLTWYRWKFQHYLIWANIMYFHV
jgi:hypothetical protein